MSAPDDASSLAARESSRGVAYAVAAFLFWGFAPIYFKLLAHVPAPEILAHRVVGAVVFTALLVTLGRRWDEVRRARDRRVLLTLVATASLVGLNWLVFIHAIATGRLVEGSLGYFINPLVNVLLGVLFLRERLRPLQTLAVLLALAGTSLLTFRLGSLPWIALVLAVTFGLYGLLRKTAGIESIPGLFVETTLLAPLALGYLLALESRGAGVFGTPLDRTSALLLLAGPVTTIPLAWYTSGARRLRYATIGMLQYLAPSLQLTLAVVFFGEAFTSAHAVTFGLIWIGLGVYLADAGLAQRCRGVA